MKRPCSVCGTPRVVNANSRTDVVCHHCRRNGHSTRMSAADTRRRMRDYRRKQRGTSELPDVWKCLACGANVQRRNGPAGMYCKQCRENTRGSHRKRARHYGVPYEPINPRAVFARDRWRCGICHHKVDLRLKHPHPRSASLDHIVPMAAGGGHVHTNVQCAHLICNVRKRERGSGEQLLLIGDVA
ncbi:HNH endonuclease [Mycobacteriaceae bacterium Msp059]|nr:HNH endonuclease [Mycobacteriaceae bacterium Msp059]